jgi:hypothetical protein
MERAARAWVAVFLAALLVSGCGGDGDEARKTAEAGGFATYEVESAGFSIGVPEEWETASVEDVFSEESIEQAAKENPEFRPIFEALGRDESPVKFFAFDPATDVESGFATNMNVIVEPLPAGVTQEQYFDANLDQIEQLFDPQDLTKKHLSLPAGEALYLAYEGEFSARTIATNQYVFFTDGGGYILTYTTVPDRANDYTDLFARSARSFRIA